MIIRTREGGILNEGLRCRSEFCGLAADLDFSEPKIIFMTSWKIVIMEIQ